MEVAIHQRCQTFAVNQTPHIFRMTFQCFYASTAQCRFGKVIKKTAGLSQHAPLKGAHVHENTLCVTSGAHRFGTNFRSLTRCSKYTANPMLSGTHVRQTTLCVTFGARLRLVRSSLLGGLFGHLRRQANPSTPERSRRATIWAPKQHPGMPSRPYFGAPAATSKSPVMYPR